MADHAIVEKEVKTLPNNLGKYNWGVFTKKHNKVMSLRKANDNTFLTGGLM